MSKVQHSRGTKSKKDSERKPSKRMKRFLKSGNLNVLKQRRQKDGMYDRALSGSIHAIDDTHNWNSRIRQRENTAIRKLIDDES